MVARLPGKCCVWSSVKGICVPVRESLRKGCWFCMLSSQLRASVHIEDLFLCHFRVWDNMVYWKEINFSLPAQRNGVTAGNLELYGEKTLRKYGKSVNWNTGINQGADSGDVKDDICFFNSGQTVIWCKLFFCLTGTCKVNFPDPNKLHYFQLTVIPGNFLNL